MSTRTQNEPLIEAAKKYLPKLNRQCFDSNQSLLEAIQCLVKQEKKSFHALEGIEENVIKIGIECNLITQNHRREYVVRTDYPFVRISLQ